MEPQSAAAEPEVDLPKLLCVAIAPYSALTAAMHPLNVMKTRAQASSSLALSRLEQLRAMVGSNGVRGLFAGLGPVLAGAVPARAAYIAALEGVRPPAETLWRSLGADGVCPCSAQRAAPVWISDL